MKYAGLPERNT